MNIDFDEVIACPNCLLSKFKYFTGHVECAQCAGRYILKDKTLYFTDVKENIIPKQSKDVRNPENWTSWRRENFMFFKNCLSGIDENSRILDLGAGQGHFRGLFEKYPYAAVDFYPYEGVNIVSDFLTRLPVKTSTFDYIILSNLLEHIKEPLVLLKECRRVLKTKGRLLITVPFIIKIHQSPYDFQRYTHYMLKYLLDEAGLTAMHINKIGSIVDLYRTMRKAFHRQAVKPRIIWKLYSRICRLTDYVYDKFLLDRGIQNDQERGYFVGYSCVAVKK